MRKVLPKKRRIKREGMPRFLYPISFLAFASWAGWGYLLFFVPPDKLTTQILFLGTFFLALFFTLTFLLYEVSEIFNAAAPPSPSLPAGKAGLRRASQRALFIATFFGLAGAMKLLEILNPLNLVLLGTILILAEIQLTRR